VPAHPGHDHILVSSELGPMIVLTGKGEAPSSVTRAIGLADALNGVVDAQLNGQAIAIEMREKPAPCVAVVGAPNCLATPTAEDVAGYDESWSTEKGARANPKLLAAQWTALLQDVLQLFVAKQRPYRMLERSPRGKVLLEIYGEATRTIGVGNGVPLNMVCPPPVKWAATLKDMALVLPGDNVAKGAAIEGLWAGNVEDGGTPRPIRIRFRVDKGATLGTLSTSQGTLTMDTPLSNVVYDKGNVQFSTRLAGRPVDFSGSLKQGVMSGTLQYADSRQPAGQFTLSFVE
jgi:hypothetical protein